MGEQTLSGWGQVLLFIIGGLVFVSLALLVSKLIRPNRTNPEKLTSYERGEDPLGTPWILYNIRFYVIELIFIILDVVIVFIFHCANFFSEYVFIISTNVD